MPTDLPPNILLWAVVLLFGGLSIVFSALVAVLVWLTLRMFARVDKLSDDIPARFAALEGLIKDEIHKLDLRVARLEAWRDGNLRGHDMSARGDQR